MLYPPVALQDKSAEEKNADLRKIHDELALCDIVMADITKHTPPEKVNEFLKIADEIAGLYKLLK